MDQYTKDAIKRLVVANQRWLGVVAALAFLYGLSLGR
jgi:hypothetical protein